LSGPWLVAAFAAATVLLLAARSPVPSEDGVSYLWMAQQFAAGRWGEGLSAVFPPGFPLLLAPLVALGAPVEWTAHAVNALALGLAAWLAARIGRRVAPDVPGAPVAAAVAFASGALLLRVAAEAYSEPCFLLLMALGTLAGLHRRCWLCGVCAGAAFWIRPEGLLLAGSFALGSPRTAWRALVPAALAVAALGGLRALAGLGHDPLPLLAFHEARDDLPDRGSFLVNLLAVPGAWLEAFGLLALLCLLALLPAVRRRLAGPAALWWQIALQVVVVGTFVVRRRFLLSCAVPVAVLGGAAVASLPRGRRRAVLALLVAGGVGWAFAGGIDADRLAERQLGQYLGARLAPGERVAGDLTRVLWFAGQRPLPPRHFDVARLAALAEPAAVRWFVTSARSRRPSSRAVLPALAGQFVPAELPDGLRQACAARGLVVLRRRPE
jgi:hypothetical protein